MQTASISFGTVADGNLTFYACPMESHSYVKLNSEGQCPDCGMDLVQKTAPYDAGQPYYTCPMASHAYVVTAAPGPCPVCGMTLTELGA